MSAMRFNHIIIFVALIISSCNRNSSSGDTIQKTFWPNGKLKKVEYLNEANSVYLIDKYDSLGIIYCKATIENGKRNGRIIFYYPSGKVREESYCLNDSLDGKYTEYYEEGMVKCTGYYKGNKGYGNTDCFDKNGHLTEVFHNYAAKTSLSGELYPSGKVLSNYPFIRIKMKSDTIKNGEDAILWIKIYNRKMLDSISFEFDPRLGIAQKAITNFQDSITFKLPRYDIGRNLITGEFKSRIKDPNYDTSIVYINVKIYQPFFVK